MGAIGRANAFIDRRRTVASAAVWLAMALAASGTAAAQDARPSQAVDLRYSSSQMERNAAGLEAAANLTVRATDLAVEAVLPNHFRKPDALGATLRLAKLIFFDVPVVNYANALNHETGHVVRVHENGQVLILTIVGGPWSSEYAKLTPEGDNSHSVDGGLGIEGGGFEAELVLERRVWQRVYQDDTHTPGDALLLLDGAVRRFRYMHGDLSTLTGIRRFDLHPDVGDPTLYVYQMIEDGWAVAGERGVSTNYPPAMAEPLKRRLWLGFADFGLWVEAWNVAKYAARGDARLRPGWLRLGGVRLAPFARYHLSPQGPQTEVGARYSVRRVVGDVSVRWTQKQRPESPSRLLGVGGSLALRQAGPVQPRVGFDLWRNVNRSTGVRVEGAVQCLRWPSTRAAFEVHAGAKTSGYVLGLPAQAGAYAGTGLRVRF